MDIILATSGGGKTRKVVELVDKYLKAGKKTLIISGELDGNDYSVYVEDLNRSFNTNFSIGGTGFSSVESVEDALKVIDKNPEYDVVFLDNVVTAFHLNYHPALFKDINSALDYLSVSEGNRKFYVTMQANANNESLCGEKLTINKYTSKELQILQRNTIIEMEKELEYYQMLYRVTNHSKKKKVHLNDIKFMQRAILSAYEEFGWKC